MNRLNTLGNFISSFSSMSVRLLLTLYFVWFCLIWFFVVLKLRTYSFADLKEKKKNFIKGYLNAFLMRITKTNNFLLHSVVIKYSKLWIRSIYLCLWIWFYFYFFAFIRLLDFSLHFYQLALFPWFDF